jgi:hypothetical protein
VETGWSEGAGMHVRGFAEHDLPMQFTVTACEFLDNAGSMEVEGPANGDGGAIAVRGITGHVIAVTVNGGLFRGNYNTQGAGIYIGRFATGTVQYCRFEENTSWYQGGGAMKGGAETENIGETAWFDYCLFRGNRAGFRPDGSETGEYSRGGGVLVRHNPRAVLSNCTFLDNSVNTYGYRIGDGFGHEGGEWTADNLCVLQNCVFWGTVGNDVQIHSEDGGIAEVRNCAVRDDEIIAVGATLIDMVWLTDSPLHATGGPLVDAAADLGFTADLAGRVVPNGNAPDIGCYERYDVTGVADDLPAAAPAVTAYPNPFNPRTTLQTYLGSAADIQLDLYDLSGRRVRRLWQGHLTAGDRAWVWDGLDDSARLVPAGIYLARLSASRGTVSVVKLTLVR